MRLALVCLSVLPYLTTALRHGPVHLHSLHRRQEIAGRAADVPSYTISIPIDHFDESDTRTFSNRYFINDTYYEPGGPVFFYDFGESAALPGTVSPVLAETAGPHALMRLARRYKGMAVGWEHRYYGKSQPFPETTDQRGVTEGTQETWQYLTLEQAMEDVVYFAKNFAPEGYTTEQAQGMAPSAVPWIWVGGSYPGSRGAWARIRNPEIIYAVWSSSAPVETVYDGSAYFATIEDSMPANCSADVKAVVKVIDEIMDRKHGANVYSQLQQLMYATDALPDGFNIASLDFDQATVWDEDSIAYAMIEPWFQNFQYSGPAGTIIPFCDYMQSYNPRSLNSSIRGTAAAVEAILKNPGDGEIYEEGIFHHWGPNGGIQAYMYALAKLQTDLKGPQFSQAVQQADENQENWVETFEYQKATELGWIMGSTPGDVTIVSKFYNFTFAHDVSVNFYFNSSVQIPDEPNVELALKYGGWDMQPSNVMFTNGEHDPWRSWSVMSTTYDKGAPDRKIVQTIPQCSTPPAGTDVFGLLYPGAVHVEDFIASSLADSDSPANQGYDLFIKALDEWLPCFEST